MTSIAPHRLVYLLSQRDGDAGAMLAATLVRDARRAGFEAEAWAIGCGADWFDRLSWFDITPAARVSVDSLCEASAWRRLRMLARGAHLQSNSTVVVASGVGALLAGRLALRGVHTKTLLAASSSVPSVRTGVDNWLATRLIRSTPIVTVDPVVRTSWASLPGTDTRLIAAKPAHACVKTPRDAAREALGLHDDEIAIGLVADVPMCVARSGILRGLHHRTGPIGTGSGGNAWRFGSLLSLSHVAGHKVVGIVSTGANGVRRAACGIRRNGDRWGFVGIDTPMISVLPALNVAAVQTPSANEASCSWLLRQHIDALGLHVAHVGNAKMEDSRQILAAIDRVERNLLSTTPATQHESTAQATFSDLLAEFCNIPASSILASALQPA